MKRPARFAVGLGLLVLAWAAPLRAGGNDYAASSKEWNGLSRLGEEAGRLGCTIVAETTLDWSALSAHDVLWIVYPRTAVDAGALRRYLQAGGRALIADDFGAADAALASLDIRRLTGELGDAPRYDDNPSLPVARATLSTELSNGAGAVVANHPAFFSTAIPATFSFSPGAALVVEGRVGDGYFVALSDPSVLINNMLELDGNLGFARALVRRTCKAGERAHLVTQSFVARGEPPADLAVNTDSLFARFNAMLESINRGAHAAADARVLLAITLLAAAILLVMFARAFSPAARISGHWTRARPPAAPDRTLVAALLRDEVAARLSESLGAPVGELSAERLRERLRARYDDATAARAVALWRRLKRARDTARLHKEARALFDALSTPRPG